MPLDRLSARSRGERAKEKRGGKRKREQKAFSSCPPFSHRKKKNSRKPRKTKKNKIKKTATPEPAAAAGGSSSSGAAPVVAPGAAPAPLSGGKKALLGSALRELTSVLGRPGDAGPAGGRGKVQGVVSSILSLALENNANGLFAQPQGIFDFGE